MIHQFLKAKHWQIFTLTFAVPMIFYFILFAGMMSTAIHLSQSQQPDPTMMLSYMKFFPIIILLFMASLFGWHWSVAIGLQNKVPEPIKMKVKKFKTFFFIPLIYMLAFLAFFSLTMNELSGPNPEPNLKFMGIGLILIIPMHLFSIFCMLYSLYFVAKTLKTVELQKEVSFSEFAGDFFLIWFFPIGVWIIQPRINKIVGA